MYLCVHTTCNHFHHHNSRLSTIQSYVQKKAFVRACLSDGNEACGDTKDEIEDFFDDNVKPLEQAVLTLGLRRRPQLMNMKRIRTLSLPHIKLSMKTIQKALHQKGGLHHGKKLSSLTSERAVLSYVRHVAMCVPTSFDEDKDYLSVERPSTALHMNSQASLFLQAIQSYCQRAKMRKTNSGIPKFPDCLTEDGGKTGRVLIVGILRGLLGRGLSTDVKEHIASYSSDCHETDRTVIDLVWDLYPRYQRWCTNFVIPVQYISGLGCVPFIGATSINKRLNKVDEWLENYENHFEEERCSSPTNTSDNRVEAEEESDHPGVAPATPANTAAHNHTPSKRGRVTSKTTMRNKSCRSRLDMNAVR